MNWLNRGLGFMFGNPAVAQLPCPSLAVTKTIPMRDGTIWITQGYIILDEIEFDLSPERVSPQFGPFAFDLTNSDPLVPTVIALSNVLPDNYQFVQFKIARFDIDSPPINLGDNQATFTAKLFDAGPPERRPSIWIEGFMESTGTLCTPFTFFTDIAGVKTMNFINNKTVDPNNLDVVLFLDIDQAFQTFNAGPSPVEDFIDEIGSIPFGSDFLDGRVFNDGRRGTQKAILLAFELFNELQIWTQTQGSFDGTMAFNAEQVS